METATASRAKLFWNGRSQAVRLPKEFRFEGSEVCIRRQGNAVVLEPAVAVPAEDWAWLHEFPGEFDPDFEKYALEEMPQQERPALDDM